MGLAQLHGYVYGRWTRQYVRFLIHRFFPSARPGARQWMSDHYHGKVLTPEQAEAIVNSERDIPLRDLEQIIPYPGRGTWCSKAHLMSPPMSAPAATREKARASRPRCAW